MHKHLAAFRRGSEHLGTLSEHPIPFQGIPAQAVVSARSSSAGTPGTPGTPKNDEGWREFAPLAQDEAAPSEAEAAPATALDVSPPNSVTVSDLPAPPRLPHAGWLPEPGPGITITSPAVEVDADEYDAHLDVMIVALADGSDERARLTFARRKGWCVERNGERIFVRGRM